jgi:hypothetical protein
MVIMIAVPRFGEDEVYEDSWNEYLWFYLWRHVEIKDVLKFRQQLYRWQQLLIERIKRYAENKEEEDIDNMKEK